MVVEVREIELLAIQMLTGRLNSGDELAVMVRALNPKLRKHLIKIDDLCRGINGKLVSRQAVALAIVMWEMFTGELSIPEELLEPVPTHANPNA